MTNDASAVGSGSEATGRYIILILPTTMATNKAKYMDRSNLQSRFREELQGDDNPAM
eukprot:CAMPEP_0196825298 /NCGR_PEP_ID=MMETSP1362-20130617/92964_1 /TAXON_ID=163516 /ORGANISM="Leptocylindrus danicus, Strain CCMP1856" /LENGTH=56 /DNA_ID=CAMNT_0042205689 /DNA_START=892 /DNA_END=1062 /DNA_ORIENTATION=+